MTEPTPFITLEEAARLVEEGATLQITIDSGITWIPREWAAKIADLEEYMPGWRDMKYENGAPKFSQKTGMMLDEDGSRSIFDDLDE